LNAMLLNMLELWLTACFGVVYIVNTVEKPREGLRYKILVNLNGIVFLS
jgi:hypothetical protein